MVSIQLGAGQYLSLSGHKGKVSSRKVGGAKSEKSVQEIQDHFERVLGTHRAISGPR